MDSFNRLLPHGARLAVALLLSGASLNFASAQVTVTTDPVGFTTTSLLGSSDSFVSIPFTRPPEFIGGIASTTMPGAITVAVPLDAESVQIRTGLAAEALLRVDRSRGDEGRSHLCHYR